MASKQYEMLFKLGAKLGENFRGTFDSAQKVLTATNKEIQALNKQQSDISAYQKQQAVIERSTKQLDTYEKQLEITQSGLAKLKNSTEDTTVQEAQLSARELELKNRIANTEQAIADKNQRLQQMGQKLSDAGIDINQLASESNRLKTQVEELTKQEEQAAEEAKRFGNSGESAFETVGSALVAAGIAAGLKKIADAYQQCVDVSMEFGGTMSTVEALSGANAVQMSELSAKARQLGADTAFTANQAAEAMTYMGMAGWGANDMLSGMDGMINLAAASGEDLALVSDIVTDNLTAFGLTAKDTAHFADVLAAAATNSNTNVAIMGETFSGSAAIAGALGYSIEDVATAVGMMANAGVKGSVAGTALKNTFNGFLNGATLTAEAFGEVEFSAINADGTINSFSDSINELRGYFEQMTEAERVQNAMAIAGQRGYNGLIAILNSSEEDYQSLTDKINNCTGAAQKMSEIKLDNLQGDVTLLDSATDGLKMTIGEMYNGELRKLTQAGTVIINGINEFCEKNPVIVKGITGIVAGMGTALAVYKGISAAKKLMNTISVVHNALLINQATATASATAAQVGLNAAMAANPVGLVIAGIGALSGLLVTAALSYESAVPSVEQLTEKAQEFDEALKEANADFDDTQVSISANADTADYYIEKLEEIEEATGGNVAENEEYHNILSLLSRTVPELSEYIDLETNSIQGGTEALRQHTDAYKKNAEEQAKQEFINSVYDEYGEVVKEVAENKIKLTQAQLKEEQALAKADKAQQRMNELMAEAEKQFRSDSEAIKLGYAAVDYLSDEYYELDSALLGYKVTAAAASEEQEIINEAIQKGEQTIAKAKEEVDLATEIVESAGSSAEGTSEQMVSAYDAVSIAVSDVTDQTTELLQAYNDAYQAAYDSVNGQYNLWTNAEETLPTSIQTINDALSSQTEYWDNYSYNLESLSKRTGDIEGLGDVIASFADGSKDSVNVIAGMADATDDELKTMVTNFEEQKKAQEEVSKSLADYKVDIDDTMDGIVDDMEKAVEDMKLSDKAEEAAKATIQAYADAILAGKGSVTTAADIVAAAAAQALSGASASDKAYEGSVRGFREFENAYASGTDYAERGIALVGEEGPELVAMRGGERVVDADNTRALLSGGSGAQITIAPQFVVNGEVSDMTEEKLQEMSERLIDMVKDALNEAGIDRQRSVYA